MTRFNLFQNKKTACVICNGCGRRMLDAGKIENYFKANNFKIVEIPTRADFIIFVTCAFTEQREEESIKIIEKLRNSKGELIIVGCLPEIAQEKFSEIFKGRFISTKNIGNFDELFEFPKTIFRKMPDSNFISVSFSSLFLIINVRNFLKKISLDSFRLVKNAIINKLKFDLNNEYYLRISYGCLGNCSYCGIKNAIGTLKSKPINTILEEYKRAIFQGYKNLSIIADDVGAYGLDINASFPKLLKEMLKIEKRSNTTFKIKELHPLWMIKYSSELVDLIKTGKINYILCGIQSGNDRLLKLMKRHHTSNEIISVLKQFKKANSNLKLSAQVIVGFPSETKDEFLDTLNLLKSVQFNEVTFYPYTDRKGTISEKMENKIPREIKMERIKIALKLLKQAKIKSYADGL